MKIRFTIFLLLGIILAHVPFETASAAVRNPGPRRLGEAHAKRETSPRALATYEAAMAKGHMSPANVFVVSDPGDQPDDSLGDGIFYPPTLRAAVENANRFPDLDMIVFAPSLTVVGKTTSNWPNVLYPVILDGAVANSGRVIIDGSAQPTGGGPVFMNGGSTIKNCEFRNFESWGILLQANAGNTNIVQNCIFRDNGNAGINFNGSTKNLIGGMLPEERNYLVGNNYGMTLIVGSDSNTIVGNYIGTMDGETAEGNESYGLWIETTGNHVVSNLISGNGSSAIYFGGSNPGAKKNVVELNLMGIDKYGTDRLENAAGISLSRGESDTIRANVISGNTFGAIGVSSNIPDVVIEENFIGTDESGAYPIFNGGAGIGCAGRRAVIRGNLVSGSTHGIEIYSGDSSTVRNNIVGDYDQSTNPLGNLFNGINVTGGRGHRIGGPGEEDGNLVSGNGHFGIQLFGTAVTECVVEGNLIGTSTSGLLALGNDSSGMRIRTGTKRDTIRDNVISGNGLDGITFAFTIDTFLAEHVVTGNLIGLAADSTTVLGNGRFGIFLDSARGNMIGQSGLPANIIGGSDSAGIRLHRSRQNQIVANLIGVLPDVMTPSPNYSDGVSLIRSSSNTIGGRQAGEGNEIAFNEGAGIRIHSGTGNRILGNDIHHNEFLGIDLVGQDQFRGVTLNDSADADEGPNNLQNFPTLTFVGRGGGNATVHGFLEGNTGETYIIDFYAVDTFDLSGFGAGDSLLDSIAVSPDSSGIAFFIHPLTGNPANIVATATGPDGSTSEFSKSAIMVNSTGDGTGIEALHSACNSGGPSVNGVPECALRAALELAEELIGPDYIGFDIQGVAPFTIHPNSELPTITEMTVIDGTTQDGYADGVPVIRISGASAGSATGLVVDNAQSSIRGMRVTDFAEQGIRCTDSFLKLHDVRVTANARTGIRCDGDLTITGPLVASLNGSQAETDAGVDVAGVLRAESTEVIGNTGRGIRAGWLNVEGNVIAADNHAVGVSVVHNVLLVGTKHTVSGNGYDGLVSQNSWVKIEGEIVANNNGNARTPSQCFTLNTAAISAAAEVILEKSSIDGNCGHGISSGSFVRLSDDCTITNNSELGLYAQGDEVRLDGPVNVISGNGRTGLLCNNGVVRVAGKLTLINNGGKVAVEDPDDCLPGLGDPRWEDGAHGLYASRLEAKDIVAMSNCGAGVAGGEIAISGIAKLNGNTSHGIAARIVSIAAGEACYNGGYGIVVFKPGGIVSGGVLTLGAVKVCMNALGGILGKPSDNASQKLSALSRWYSSASAPSTVNGGSITDNIGDGIAWQTEDSLVVTECNISGNANFGIAADPGAGPVVADNVWWGSADGPGGTGPGSGDGVSSGVDYANWASSAHTLSLAAPAIVYVEPGAADSFAYSLSKWEAGDEQVTITILDTAGWVNSMLNFIVTATDTAPVVNLLELDVPGGVPEGSQAEIRIVAAANSNPSINDTTIVAVFAYQPQLTSIDVFPDSVTLPPGGTVNFFASGFDQHRIAHPFLGVWSTDGGTITNQGLFTAGQSLGEFSVNIVDTSGLISASAAVQVAFAGCACDCDADPLCDGATDILDVTQVINVAFRNFAPIPDTDPSCPWQTTDVNCDGATDILDVTRLINVAFRNGAPAGEFCVPCP